MEPTETQFMTAKQLRGMRFKDVEISIGRGRVGTRQNITKSVMAQKLRQSKKSGLYDSIKESGVKDPVTILKDPSGTTTVQDGHHRIASAMSIYPSMKIPVKHEEW